MEFHFASLREILGKPKSFLNQFPSLIDSLLFDVTLPQVLKSSQVWGFPLSSLTNSFRFQMIDSQPIPILTDLLPPPVAEVSFPFEILSVCLMHPFFVPERKPGTEIRLDLQGAVPFFFLWQSSLPPPFLTFLF